MAKAVVLLFLLDSLPDFDNVIMTTLHKIAPGLNGVTCDPTLTAPVLQVIGKKLNLTEDSVEKLQNINIKTPRYPTYKLQELTPELLNNGGFQDNSIRESNEFSIEKSPNFIEHVYPEKSTQTEDILEKMAISKNEINSASKAKLDPVKNTSIVHSYGDINNKKENLKIDLTNGKFPESAPFLAAIFETVGNVTAQTCGGVVLGTHWVLTAAACVNVLKPFYSNSSKENTDNYYSVVATANDPLKDGTVHQVSKIYLHPTPESNRLKNWFNSLDLDPGVIVPSMALLRVEPEVKGGAIGLMRDPDEMWDGVTRIYGWALRQNQTGFEMKAVSSQAKMLSRADCKKIYGIVDSNSSMLCLSVDETTSNHTKMSSGCPVVTLQNGRMVLYAVALTDGSETLLATPLAAHSAWLLKLTGESYGQK